MGFERSSFGSELLLVWRLEPRTLVRRGRGDLRLHSDLRRTSAAGVASGGAVWGNGSRLRCRGGSSARLSAI